MEITIRNNQRLIRINQRRIESILKKVLKHLTLNHRRYSFIESAEISVLFVNDRKMRELNLQYRGKDKTTDVLSFPQQDSNKLRVTSNGFNKEINNSLKNLSLVTRHPLLPLGDIVINIPQAKRQALEHGLTFYDEIAWLLIHGLLHLLGYDHEKNRYQARKMREMEQELLGVTGVFPCI